MLLCGWGWLVGRPPVAPPDPVIPSGAPTWRGLPVYPNGERMERELGHIHELHTFDGEAEIRARLDHTWHGGGKFERIPIQALDSAFGHNVSYQGVSYVYEVYEDSPYSSDGPHVIHLREGQSHWDPAFDCKRC